jgi:hypothetical protein
VLSLTRSQRSPAAIALVVAISSVLIACSASQLLDRSVVLVGAGDIASCSYDEDEATAKVLDNIDGTVFTAGDNAYDSGTASEFKKCYDPTWGRHKVRTKPTPGNHEYETKDGSGYYDYFGAAAGERGEGYYSYDLGDWHIIALNSQVCGPDASTTCGSFGAQVRWLENDLAANETACTLAYWHNPLFSSGSEHGNQERMRPIWEALYEANADVVVNGHDHNYERFAPQDPGGARDAARGIREFVVGTGGAALRPFGEIQPNSQVRNAEAHGVLKLTLRSESYDWEFVPVTGETFTDSGTDDCHQ